MTSQSEKKTEPAKQGFKGTSRSSQKMFFNETEDEYEESKMMMPQEDLLRLGDKEGNLPKTGKGISDRIPFRMMNQDMGLC